MARDLGSTIDPRRTIPAVGKLLSQPRLARLINDYGRELVRVQVQRELDLLRAGLGAESSTEDSPPTARVTGQQEELDKAIDRLALAVESNLETLVGRPLRRVLNATGIFLHTNLGRAPLPRDTASAFPELLNASCDLELDLVNNRRDDRNRRSELLLRQLTGAEAALVVNNNAAALVLMLATLARGRSVVVSRGELVEIGGSFRIPDIIEAAGSRMVEVGTTNRTRISDYEKAVDTDTALLLKIHPSNYRIEGFAESVTADELVELGRRHQLPVAVDEGSGLLLPHSAPQLRDHRSLSELVAGGCDLVCGSGDKVLGGPQAGLLVGRAVHVDRCRRHPFYRALRPSRGTFIGLEPVLRKRLVGDAMPIDRLWSEADALRPRLERAAIALGARIVEADAFVGGGAAPAAPIPGLALALPADDRLLDRLRGGDPPVVGYVREGWVRLDLRTVDPEDDASLIEAVAAALRRGGSRTEGPR